VNHLIAVPFVLFGVALAVWAKRVAAFYASVFRALGARLFERAYEHPLGVAWVRLAGAIMAVVGVYWVVVGTG
jgi:hypothetical protein